MIHGWRAWYSDGHVTARYDSGEFEPQELPPDGLVGIVEYERPPYRKILDGADWFTWDGERWGYVPSGEWGTWKPKPEAKVVIRAAGRLPDEEYERIAAEMQEDRTWP